MAKKKGLHRSCGTMAAHMMMLEKYPAFRARQTRLENATARRRAVGEDMSKLSVKTIKTVVNVVHRTAAQNVSNAQIASQIKALNSDFRATNPDRALTPTVWKGLVTDSRIQFKLVRVTRFKTTKTAFSHDDGVKRASTGGVPPFKPNSHLNIWVCALTGGLLGYAQFPGGPSATDGVVINFQAFGTIGTAQAPFNRGRTTTHEVGHYFNLRHIWADTPDCSGSDLVADTPNCEGPNFGTPTGVHVTCGNAPHGDMYMNYMDYTDDKGMFMFTAGQVARMRTALTFFRSGL